MPDAFGNNTSDPFVQAPDPFFAPTKAKQKKATKEAVKAVSPEGEQQYGEGFSAATGLGPPAPDPTMPANEIEIGGKKYRFTQVQDPYGRVEDYTARGDAPIDISKAQERSSTSYGPLGDLSNFRIGKGGELEGSIKSELTDKEYDTLTREAAGGNKLAQQILVKGHYKAQNFPSLMQDLNKIEDPFVKALGNLPNVEASAEKMVSAVTQPYDFSNAETQVNNLLSNQTVASQSSMAAGLAGAAGAQATAQGAGSDYQNPFAASNPFLSKEAVSSGGSMPAQSAQTKAYLSALNKIGAPNLASSAIPGIPSFDAALASLGPAAKLSEKASPQQALLSALLSHLQYQDVYGTGLASAGTSQNPAWLQQLIASVTGLTSTGGLVNPALAGGGVGSVPSAGTSTVPNTG
jgi:hypothetical protein